MKKEELKAIITEEGRKVLNSETWFNKETSTYEDEIYTEMKKGLPNIGQFYKKDNVEGKIVSLNLLKKTALIETKNKSLVEVEI